MNVLTHSERRLVRGEHIIDSQCEEIGEVNVLTHSERRLVR